MDDWLVRRTIAVRLLAASTLGIAVTSLLMLLMHALISTDQEIVFESRTSVADVVVQKQEEQIRQDLERPKLEEPQSSRRSPPLPQLRLASRSQISQTVIPTAGLTNATPKLTISGPSVGMWSGFGSTGSDDLVPLGRPFPEIPQKALINGISGWVDVAFTVGVDGRVRDADVIASEPDQLFDAAALKAVYRWRFKPPIVDGHGFERRAQVRLEFTIDAAL